MYVHVCVCACLCYFGCSECFRPSCSTFGATFCCFCPAIHDLKRLHKCPKNRERTTKSQSILSQMVINMNDGHDFPVIF